MSARNDQPIFPQHHLRLHTVPQDFDVFLQHGTVDFQFEVHQEAEADLQSREIEIGKTPNPGESIVGVAKVLECLRCYSQSGQHEPMGI